MRLFLILKKKLEVFGSTSANMQKVNKLDYSLSLREKSLSKEKIIKEMKSNGFDETEIRYYLKRSDELYLDKLLNNKQSKPKGKSSSIFKTIVLLISLLLLFAVFYGYATIGLIGLFLFWSLVKFGTSKN